MTAAGQWFFFGPWRFSIREALELISRAPRQTHQLPVPPWASAYGLDLIDNPDDRSVALIGPHRDTFNREYAMGSDLSQPVIVATLKSGDGDTFLLIDGTHRLYRSWREGLPELPAYLLSAMETQTIQQHR